MPFMYDTSQLPVSSMLGLAKAQATLRFLLTCSLLGPGWQHVIRKAELDLVLRDSI